MHESQRFYHVPVYSVVPERADRRRICSPPRAGIIRCNWRRWNRPLRNRQTHSAYSLREVDLEIHYRHPTLGGICFSNFKLSQISSRLGMTSQKILQTYWPEGFFVF